MPKCYTWTDEQLQAAIPNSISIRQVLIKLGLDATGANYKAVPKRIKQLNLDISHFLGRAHTKGRKNPRPTKPLNLKDFLVEGTHMETRIKRQLLKEGLLINECSWCKISTWKIGEEEKPLVLHIDHINGKNTDNRIENLRLLCPNCHSLTDTYAGKNKKISRKLTIPADPRKTCPCGNTKYRDSLSCRKCAGKRRSPKIEWPSDSELIKRVQESSFLAAGKELGVSDNAVRKRIKNKGYSLVDLGLTGLSKH